MTMTPEIFADCIRALKGSPADFTVRALIHAADALQATPYHEGGRLIIKALSEIQERPLNGTRR